MARVHINDGKDAFEGWIAVFDYGCIVCGIKNWREDGVMEERERGPCCKPNMVMSKNLAMLLKVA